MLAFIRETNPDTFARLRAMLQHLGFSDIRNATRAFASRGVSCLTPQEVADLAIITEDNEAQRSAWAKRCRENLPDCPVIALVDRLPRKADRVACDAYLSKPFTQLGFLRAIVAAHRKHRSHSATLMVSVPEEQLAPLISQLQQQLPSPNHHWKRIAVLPTEDGAVNKLLQPASEVGCLIALAGGTAKVHGEDLLRTKKLRRGHLFPFVSLSRAPDLAKGLRTHASSFLDFPSSELQFRNVLVHTSALACNNWSIHWLAGLAQNAIDAHEFWRARTLLYELAYIQPLTSLYWKAVGDLYLVRGKTRRAIKTYERAIAENPFDAAAHLKLIHLLANDARAPAIRELARLYCSDHPGIVPAKAAA